MNTELITKLELSINNLVLLICYEWFLDRYICRQKMSQKV